MSVLIPLFPLGTVALPGMVLPLHIFEDRYRELVSDLLAISEPQERVFGIVAIREGYEVGEHSARSMFRVGCLMRLHAAQVYADGRYDVSAQGRSRFRVEGTDASGAYLRAQVTPLDDLPGATDPDLDAAATATLDAFSAYRSGLSQITGGLDLDIPPAASDPATVAYQIGAASLLPLNEQQRLLEAPTTLERLQLLHGQLTQELVAMRAVPSLPATQIARSDWSPN